MNLIHCQDQKSKTLDEFFLDVSQHDHPVSRENGKTMLDLLARLRALPNANQVYGLTSHYRLCLLAYDSWKAPWLVIINALGKQTYYVEYLMPKHTAPWPHAYVRGEASSEDDAVKMIVIAMDRSEGWSNSN